MQKTPPQSPAPGPAPPTYPESPPPSPVSPTSASRTPLPADVPDLSPLPRSPPRTSSSISTSRPQPLLPSFPRAAFMHGLVALLAQWTLPCTSPPAPQERHSLYYGIHPPQISLKNYVQRLLTHTHCSPSAFVVALVNLRRVAARHVKLRLCNENLHRLVITALTLAVKMLDDRVFSMAHYARVGGVPTAKELVRLERQFVVFANARLFVRRKTFLNMLRKVWDHRNEKLGPGALRPPPLPRQPDSAQPATGSASAAGAASLSHGSLSHANATTVGTTSTKPGMQVSSVRVASDVAATSGGCVPSGAMTATSGEQGADRKDREEGTSRQMTVHSNKRKKGNESNSISRSNSGQNRNIKEEDEDEDEDEEADIDKEDTVPITRTPPDPPPSERTVMTAHGETGERVPRYGPPKPRQKMYWRSANEMPDLEEMQLGPTSVEDDSGALDEEDDEVDADDIELYEG